MYGYIRPHTPELKVREQEYYRAVYCGLCRTMGKTTGQASRTTLSYDFTFFALCRMALGGEAPEMRPRRCIAHPTVRRPMVEPNDTLRLCADLSAILAYHKMRDDIRDERGPRRAAVALSRPYFATIRRRAKGHGHDAADGRVGAAMEALVAMEAARPASVDAPADLFGDLLGALLSEGLSGGEEKIALSIGRHVGRWVYILDAADDYAKDVRAGRYNPFACLYGDPAMQELPADKREDIRLALLSELSELECAMDLLDTTGNPDLGGLLANILYMGMPRAAERVLCPESCEACADSSESRGGSRRREHKRA